MTVQQRERHWKNEAVRREREILEYYHRHPEQGFRTDGSFVMNFAKRYRAAMNRAAAKRKGTA